MKQTAKFGCRVFVALLCLAMFASVITVPAFAAESSVLSSFAGQDLSAFIDLINKYNSVKDDPDAADQLKDYVEEQYTTNESFKESADAILGTDNQAEAQEKFDTVIDNVLVNDEVIGDIDEVVDAIQNGATADEIIDSIKAQTDPTHPEYAQKDTVHIVTWKIDGAIVDSQQVRHMKLIPACKVKVPAGNYIKWDTTELFATRDDIVINGTVVDVVDQIVSKVNALPVNYGEYEMVYDGTLGSSVATLYIDVNAGNYKQIISEVLGDVRADGTGVYTQALTAFMNASAMEIYNGKINTVSVNGYEVVTIEGYGITELVELMDTIEAGNYGEIISAAGLKNALLVDPVTPGDMANIGDDGVLATYDVVLGAEGVPSSEIKFNVALRGNLDLIRNAAKTIVATYDYVVDQGGDLNVEIFVPGAFTKVLAQALNSADVSDETKRTIVKGISECATVGEMYELFDLLTYDQFTDVVECLFENLEDMDNAEKALLEKIEDARPAFDLLKEFGDILIANTSESALDKEASFTLHNIYTLTQIVSFDDFAALVQLKNANALADSALYNDVVANIASKLNISTAAAQNVADRMVDAYAAFQTKLPDSAKAESAYEYAAKAIDLLYNKIPAELKDVKLTDTYKGNGVFGFAFSTTYNPGAWIKNILDNVTIVVYSRSITLGDLVPTRDITSDVSVTVTVADLYKVTFVDEKGATLFEGFLPYGAELAPYFSDLEEEGHTFAAFDEEGDELTTMPAADTVVIVKKIANEYTITFDVLGTIYTETFKYGEIPTLSDELYLFDTLNFKGWVNFGTALPAVTEDATYVAEYTATITFQVADKTHTKEVAYNELPVPEGAWTTLNTLTFKGWTTALAPATSHAIYVADLWATITFIVDGQIYDTVEVPYNSIPSVASPFKPMDTKGTYAFKGWTPAISKAVAHTSYVAEFALTPHDAYIEKVDNVFKVYLGEYVANGTRLTASANIMPALQLAAREVDSEVLAIVVGKDSVDGAHDVTVLFDHEAVVDMLNNATGAKVILEVSSVLDEEAQWPTFAAYGDYEEIYSFDLVGSVFNKGNAEITVPFAAENKGAYYAFIDYVGATIDPMLEKAKDADTLTFTTTHFSYYAVKYVQYKFTVNFFDINGTLVESVVIDTDKGETLENVPAFTVTAPTADGHYVSKWYYGARSCSPVEMFSNNARDYDFKEKQTLEAHTYGEYDFDDVNHWCVCSVCGYELKEAHTLDNNGDCVCGYHKDVTTETEPPVTTEPGSETEPPVTTEPGSETEPPVTTEPGSETEPPVTTEPGSETESDTEPVGGEKNKNGWWIFLIVLLVIVATLIVVYILYGHNIFPKGPANEEPAKEEPEELTDAQKGNTVVTEEYVPEEVVHVDHVSVSEADELMSDVQAVHMIEVVAVNYAASGKMGSVNVGALNEHYEAGEKVDIESLKEKKLIDADCKRVKILADGDLDKVLVVEANSFSLQAIKMITLTGGHALKIQNEDAQDAEDNDDAQ